MVLRIVLILGNTNNLQMSLKKPIFKLTTKFKLIFLRPLKKLKRIYIYIYIIKTISQVTKYIKIKINKYNVKTCKTQYKFEIRETNTSI